MDAWYMLKRLQEEGFSSYFVGGCVRDMILNIPYKDIDIATQARPDEIISIFKDECKIKEMGKSFGVVLVDGIEVATFRKDRYFGFDDKKVEIKYADTIEEDLARRDLTINSIAYNPFNNKFIDTYNGRKDIENRIIRFTGNPKDRIFEDPNRILRACRFLAKIEGKFNIETYVMLNKYSNYIHLYVAPERIHIEILKAMEVERPSFFFDALYVIGGLIHIFPNLVKAKRFYHGKHHDESVYDHCMICGDSLSPRNKLLRLVGYLHDIGKVETFEDKEDGDRTFYNHEYAGEKWILGNLPNLKFSDKETKYIANIIRIHMRGLKQASPKAIRRLLKSLDEKNIKYQDFLRLKVADRKANLRKNNYSFSDVKVFVKRYKNELYKEDENSFLKLAINGNDIMKILNLKPGKDVGRIKKILEDVIIKHPEYNIRAYLINYIKGKWDIIRELEDKLINPKLYKI